MHINQRVIGPYHWRRDGQSVDEVVAENPVGKVSSVSSCPFIYKIVESKAVPLGDGMFEISWVVEPASVDEATAYEGWTYDANEDREDQARYVVAELRQKSWYSGIPADAMIFCEGHQKTMPAHGANYYDDKLICNKCVERIEVGIARKEIVDPQVWIRERAAISTIINAIDEVEARGEGCVQLGERKWLEITVLYSFIRNSEYKADAHIEKHYPYEDMVPIMYRGYLREDWSPGEYFNSPVQTIVFTSRNKLTDFLESGGRLPAQERKKIPVGRPTQGRTERIQWSATPELKEWLKTKSEGRETLGDTTFRLLENMRYISE